MTDCKQYRCIFVKQQCTTNVTLCNTLRYKRNEIFLHNINSERKQKDQLGGKKVKKTNRWVLNK